MGKSGGLARKAQFIKDYINENGAGSYFLLDSGNAMFSFQSYSYFSTIWTRRKQMELKASFIMDVYEKMGYDAVNIGWYDVVLGRDFLKSVTKDRKINFISSNLYDKKEGKLFAAPYVIIEKNGKKIGVIGVMSNDTDYTEIKLDEELEIKDPIASAEENIKLLEGNVDLIVALSSLGEKGTLEFAKKVSGIDVIIDGGLTEKKGDSYQQQIKNTLIVKRAGGGKELGMLKCQFNDPNANLREGTQIEMVKKQLAETDERISRVKNKEDKTLPKEMLKNKKMLEEYVKILEGQKAPFEKTIAEFNKANWYIADSKTLYIELPEDSATREAIKKYYADVAEYEKKRGSSERNKGNEKRKAEGKEYYRGADYCKDCHKKEYDFWKTTKHAKAYETLENIGRNYDPDCIGCHTTGYNYPGGFFQANEVGIFKNVQCEMCHVIGSKHMKKKSEQEADKPKKGSGGVGEGYCIICHASDYKPATNFEDYFKKISCRLNVKKEQ